jgi:hypothetical protein
MEKASKTAWLFYKTYRELRRLFPDAFPPTE